MSARVKTKYMMLLGILSLGIYFSIQQIVSHQYDFLTTFDKSIPFLPWTVWIYHSIVPVIVATMFLLVKSKRLFFTTFWASVVTMLLVNIFYLLFPSFYPRPEFVPSTITDYFVHWSYMIDNSSNTFPSGHVAFAWLMYWGGSQSQKAQELKELKRVFLLWAIGLSLSTLTLKMHYLIDVLGGFAVGTISFFVIKSYIKKYSLYSQETQP